jgi:hypothetical protein
MEQPRERISNIGKRKLPDQASQFLTRSLYRAQF